MIDETSLSLRILDSPVDLLLEDADLSQVISALWSPFVVDTRASSPDLGLRRTPEGEFLLERGYEVLERTADPWHMLLRLKVEITAVALDQRKDLLLVHSAGVIEEAGGALLLVGQAGAGKTSLSTDLAFRGLPFMGDDLVAIDPATLDALPIPRPPAYKGEVHTQRDFADRWVQPEWLATNGPFMVPACAVGKLSEGPTPIGRIAFTRFLAETLGTVRPISRAQAVVTMGEQTHDLDADRLSVLLRLFEMVDAFWLEYPDSERAVELLT